MENKNLEEADVNEKQKVRNGKSAMPMRTCLVMILAGVYVAYLGVSLCQNVINGAEGSSPGSVSYTHLAEEIREEENNV